MKRLKDFIRKIKKSPIPDILHGVQFMVGLIIQCKIAMEVMKNKKAVSF